MTKSDVTVQLNITLSVFAYEWLTEELLRGLSVIWGTISVPSETGATFSVTDVVTVLCWSITLLIYRSPSSNHTEVMTLWYICRNIAVHRIPPHTPYQEKGRHHSDGCRHLYRSGGKFHLTPWSMLPGREEWEACERVLHERLSCHSNSYSWSVDLKKIS